VAGIHKIQDSDISLGGMFTMQSARVLLQSSFSGDRHCQHQGVERRVIKTLADKFSGSEQDAGSLRWQGVKFSDQD
jgi:hypothetical protein